MSYVEGWITQPAFFFLFLFFTGAAYCKSSVGNRMMVTNVGKGERENEIEMDGVGFHSKMEGWYLFSAWLFIYIIILS